jgi:hypothetical protein
MWTSAKYGSSFEETKIYSEVINSNNYPNGKCFSLKHIIDNPDASLTIYYKYMEENNLKVINTIKGSTLLSPYSWKRELISLDNITSQFELYIVMAQSNVGVIAIDDLFLYEKTCDSILAEENAQNSNFKCNNGTFISSDMVCNFIRDCPEGEDEKICADCDFEISTCQYSNSNDSILIWERVQAKEAKNGPTVDNTLKTPDGHYLYVKANSQFNFVSASLELKLELKPCSSSCILEFYYHMFGESDDLIVHLDENEKDYTILLELKGDFGDKWNYARIPIGRISAPFRIGFDADRYFNQNDYDLAIDDIRLIDCEFPHSRPTCPSNYFTCNRKACVAVSRVCDLIDDCGDNSDESKCDQFTSCDFEESMCDWKLDTNSNSTLKWELHKGSSRFNTGPSRDHTTGLSTGQYVYIKRTFGVTGDKARLLSPVFTVNNSCHLRLFYHMNEEDMSEFNVKLRTQVNGPESLLFSNKRAVGNFWDRVDLSITNTEPFQIIIEGVLGTDFRVNIALDDTSFTPGCVLFQNQLPSSTSAPTTTKPPVCGYDGFQCKAKGNCIPLNKTCNFEKDCSDGSDEENCGTCNFEVSSCGWADDSNDEFNFARKQAPSPNVNGPQIDHTYGSRMKGYFMYTALNTSFGNFPYSALLSGPSLQETGEYCQMSFWLFMKGDGSYIEIFVSNSTKNSILNRLDYIYGSQGSEWKNKVVTIGKLSAGYHIVIKAYPDYNDEFDYYDIAFDDIVFADCAPNSIQINQSLDCDFELDLCGYKTTNFVNVQWTRIANKSESFRPTGPSFDHTTGVGYYALFQPLTFNPPPYKTGMSIFDHF